MARVTERVRLGPAALNPFTLHPYEIAGQTAMLDLVSGGRAYLGLVKGAWLDRLGLDDGAAAAGAAGGGRDRAASSSPVTRAASRGERFTLEPGTALAYEPRAARRCRCMVGTWGERTAAWAGTVADEIKIGGSANPDLVPVVRRWLGGAARVRIVVGCVTVVDEDGAWARERARAAVAPYLDVVARLDPTLELRPGQEPPLDRFAIAGTPEEVAARVVDALGGGRRPRRARNAAGPDDAGGRAADLRARAPAAALSR